MTAQEQKSYKAGKEFSRALLKERGLNIAFIQGVEDEISDRWFACAHCEKLGLQHDPRQEFCTNKCKQAQYRQLKMHKVADGLYTGETKAPTHSNGDVSHDIGGE
jgi:hypothetical protein